MTGDPSPCRDTDLHVQPHKTFYKTKIPVGHKQLRNLISSPEQNLVYYVNRKHVYLLDTSKRKRAYIAELPFEPRCTATGYGYFCAGGDHNGQFAWLKLPDIASARNSLASGPLSAYASGVDRSSSAGTFDYIESNNWHLVRRPRLEHLGNEIVNSVTIHRFKGDGVETTDDVIAVLTNNDHTVRWFSLIQGRQVREEKFDYPLNHATISPDGNLTIVVGDKEFAHFLERIEPPSSASKNAVSSNTSLRYPSQEWTLLRKLRLHKPRGTKGSCYFTTAWSGSAKLCATASEHGYVTLFDTKTLRDLECDPIVALVPSSRPLTIPGAVRSMCFAPDPWDLILWTENHGRICVGDLRTGLATRQVIQLDPSGDNVETVELPDSPALSNEHDIGSLDAEIDFLRRHQRALSQGDNASAVSFATDYLAAAAERRRLERQGAYSEVDPDPYGLTEQERQILQGLRTSREREEMLRYSASAETSTASQDQRLSPRSIVYSTGWQRNVPASQTQHIDQHIREITSDERREAAELDALREEMSAPSRDYSGNSNASSLARIQQQQQQQQRQQQQIQLQLQQQQRRSLMTPSATDGTPSTTRSGTPSSIAPIAATTDAWRTIEAAMQRAAPSSSPNPASISDIHNADIDHTTVSSPITNVSATAEEEELMANALNLAASPRRGDHQHSGIDSSSGQASTAITLPHLRERATDAAFEARREQLLQRAEALAARSGEMARGNAFVNEISSARARSERERELRRNAAMLGALESSLMRPRSGVSNGRMAPVGSNRGTAAMAMSSAAGDSGLYSANANSLDPDGDWGTGTAGAAFADSGRLLYIGTEQGVFELKLDLKPRQFWPAWEMR